MSRMLHSICCFPKTLKSVKVAVFLLNRFSFRSTALLYGSELRLNFKRHRKNSRLDGMFAKTGITGIPEALDHEAADKVLSFLVALVDGCCLRH